MLENGSPTWVENCLYEKTLSFSYEVLPHTGKMKIQYEKFQVFDMKVLLKVFQIKTIKMPNFKERTCLLFISEGFLFPRLETSS